MNVHLTEEVIFDTIAKRSFKIIVVSSLYELLHKLISPFKGQNIILLSSVGRESNDITPWFGISTKTLYCISLDVDR